MSFFKSYPADAMTGLPIGPRTTRRANRPEPGHTGPVLDPEPELPPAPSSIDPTDPYPDGGSIAAVLEWVDRAPNQGLRSDRAKAAIVAEHGRGEGPRTTLLPQLDERTG